MLVRPSTWCACRKDYNMKKVLLVFVVMLFSLGCFFACGDEENGGNTNTNQDEIDYGTSSVFVPGDTVQIVSGASDTNALAEYIRFHLSAMLSDDNGKGGAHIASIYHESIAHEVVIGLLDEERPATVKAYQALERIEKESYFDMRYVVYSYDDCIAIAYDFNEYTTLSILDVIGDTIVEQLFKDKEYVAVAEGIVLSGTVDLIDEQEELDLEILGEAWENLEAAAGTETTNALRTLYSMYGEDLTNWIANLYDPGTGGFYASSGGRDGAEFGPDVQCTVQLLRFMSSSGMVNNISSKPYEFIPEFMQQQMIYFAKSLQDPSNGHFYHPQWGKGLTDTHLSRRGRDLGWATDLLSTFNSAPAYRAPNGTLGDGVTADEYWANLVESGAALGPKPYPSTKSPTLDSLKEKLEGGAMLTSSVGLSTEDAVSMVILTSNPEDVVIDSSTAYLSTHTNFIDYLLVTVAPGMDNNPYSMGNNLNATYSQIKDSSNKLGAYTYTEGDENTSTNAALAVSQFKVNGDADKTNDLTIADIYKLFDGKNLKEMTIFVLDEKINPEIGLWGQVTANKPKGTEFRYTNGFFKVITLYNSWGFAYPDPEAAADALMEGLLGDEPSTGNICEVYNVWSAISTLRSNLQFVEDEERVEAIKKGIQDILDEKSAAAVENTYNKVKGYKKYDGGFSHSYTSGTGSHQGLPVGHSELNQSDVDATCIGSTGLTRAVFDALGLSYYKIPLYTEADWMKMLEIFISQDPVIKYSYDGEVVYTYCHDFESDVPEAAYFKYTTGITENTFTKVALNGDGVGLLNKMQSGKQSYLDFKINDTVAIANTTVYESEIMLTDLKASSEPIELRFYDGTNADKRIYTLYIYATQKTDGTAVYIAPKSDKSNKVEVGKVGEWFTLRLAYCQGEIGSETAPSSFKVYINDSKTPVLVDEKFESGSAINAKNIGYARFLTMSSFSGKIYVDDIRFAHENVDYVYDKPTHNTGSAGGTTTPETPPASDYPGLPTTGTGSTTTSVDGKVTFDNVTAFPITAEGGIVVSDKRQDTWKGHIISVTEEGNSFLRVVDLYDSSEKVEGGDGGQCIFLFDRPDYTGTDQTFVFEAKFRISKNADGKLKDNKTLFDITFRNNAGTRVYRSYFGDGALSLNGTSAPATELWTTGDWFTIRIEYTVIGDSAETASWDVKGYVNGNLVKTSSSATVEKVFGNSLAIDKVGILPSREFIGHLDIDDVKIYQKAAE